MHMHMWDRQVRLPTAVREGLGKSIGSACSSRSAAERTVPSLNLARCLHAQPLKTMDPMTPSRRALLTALVTAAWPADATDVQVVEVVEVVEEVVITADCRAGVTLHASDPASWSTTTSLALKSAM